MSVLDYQPIHAGAHYDPEPAGGKMSRLDLYATPDRSGTPTASVEAASRLRPGVYRFSLPDVPMGRYWATVTFTRSQGTPPVRDTALVLDLPTGQGLVVSPEAVADELGLPLPLDAAQRSTLTTAIRNAQADVVGYLGRPLIPRTLTLLAVQPRWSDDLDSADTWPLPEQDDLVDVEAYRPRGDGTYDVDVLVGLNAAAEPAVRRYVAAHAAESERNRPNNPVGEGRRVSSVSAEGQSISYEAAPVVGQAGAPPTLDSLSSLRRLLFRPVTRPARAPWPYSASPRYRRR
ncbi:hypothetical protein ACIO3O_37295 [Streptomyces sp. NPDC087440]|uniref:hypothetical protein n=1 Tax=Streptomyces sp. NPDC087440 TaxID=3365790 RepID=UPI0038263605